MNYSKNVKVVTLSGVEGIGRNCYVVEYKEDIFIIDYGMTFPEGDGYGVDYILPDYQWLMENKHRIKALIVTHAHLDHVGGIPFVIEKLGFPPIYGSPFAIEFVADKLKEHNLDHLSKLNVVMENDVLNFGEVKASFFHVTHSIPQCYGVCLTTPEGRIVYTGDYKFDDSPLNEKPSNYAKIEELGKMGVLAAMLDSTNAYEAGQSKSETEILENLEEVIKQADGRVIIATFSSLVTRIAGLFEVAKRNNKRLFFTGRSVENNIKIAFRVGYIHPEPGIIVEKKDLSKIPDNQLIIVTTGSQGEPMAALTRMAFNKHSLITIKKTDTIIISSSVIPTNTMDVQRLVDELARKGARIINNKLMDVHVSGHAKQEDMKRMAKMLNAKYYIPVHGYLSFLTQHKLVLKEAGIDESRVLIASEGSIFSFNDGNVTQEPKIKTMPAAVVGDVILEKGEGLIRDRMILSNTGICSIVLALKDSKIANVSVLLRGFDTIAKNEKVLDSIRARFSKWYVPNPDDRQLKKMLYARLGAYFANNQGRTPVLCIDVVHL